MMSTEKPEVFEVTCLDCGTTKTYFTEQGATYFKLNHQGHNLKVKEEGAQGGKQASTETAVEAKPAQAAQPVQAAQPAKPEVVPPPEPVQQPRPEEKAAPAPVPEAPLHERREPAPIDATPAPVRLSSLVVDVVDNGEGRVVEVYGVAGGKERFSKKFYMRDLNNLNLLLESGGYTDPSTLASFVWSPEKIDLSEDVVRMLDESAAGSTATKGGAGGARVVAQTAEMSPTRQPVRVPAPALKPGAPITSGSPSKSVSEEPLLGKLSYVQPGDEYALECLRVSRVLRKFRWNTELPYVIGAMFDDLLSVQSQTGSVKGELIEAVEEIGYTFVAIESPSGIVTAWFRRKDEEPVAKSEDGPL